MPQLLATPGKDPVPIVQDAGLVSGLFWTGAENLASTRIRSLDHPACSQSLYRLSYPARTLWGLV
jgi:GH24 family phage-related lysozyme (muramidase)